jgi:hypothetical protein
VFDAGPVLADLVTGSSWTRADTNGRGKRRALVAVLAAAVLVLGTGAVAFALASDDDEPDARVTGPTNGPTAAATSATTEPEPSPTTEPPTTTTLSVAPPPTPAPTTQPPATQPPPGGPTVTVEGPTSIEDSVASTWRVTAADATSGQWTLAGTPTISLNRTDWRPGGAFQVTPGCAAVGATYQLSLTVSGPGGSATSSIPFTVVDTDGTCA